MLEIAADFTQIRQYFYISTREIRFHSNILIGHKTTNPDELKRGYPSIRRGGIRATDESQSQDWPNSLLLKQI